MGKSERMKIKVKSADELEKEAPASDAANGDADQALDEAQDQQAQAFEQCMAQRAELEDRFMRLAAEFDNYKKRGEREKAEFLKRANEGMAGDLLPVLDNLERALDAAGDADKASLQKGVEMVLHDLRKALERHGLEVVDALGQRFDPQMHEAMMQQENPDVEEGTVLSQYQKGYLFQGRLLRPAMVVVSKAPAAGEDDPTAD